MYAGRPAWESLARAMLRVDVLTLFPEMFPGVLGTSILRIARERGALQVEVHDIREHGLGRHRQVDDTPYGGGPGMVLRCEPIFDAVEGCQRRVPGHPGHLVMLTPQGRPFTQAVAQELSEKSRLILLAGHYEGFDDRIREGLQPDEISVGDVVLTGGELPALMVIDAVTRLLPGVLGHDASTEYESFSAISGGLLDYPVYTRPAAFRGMSVPDVLLSGNHEAVARWRLEQSRARTFARRPDLPILEPTRRDDRDRVQRMANVQRKPRGAKPETETDSGTPSGGSPHDTDSGTTQ